MSEAIGNENGKKAPQSSAEIEPRKLFLHSLLEIPIQFSLVNEITTKLREAILLEPPPSPQNTLKKFGILRKRHPLPPATHPKVYVVTSHRVEKGTINPPFTITAENPGERVDASIEGPFDPQLAGAVAYLEQEGRMLMAAPPDWSNSDVKALKERHDIQYLASYGGGMHDLAWELHKWKKNYPQEAREEVLQKVREEYQSGIENYTKRAQDYEKQFDKPGSRDVHQLTDLTSRLQGFETGILLLDELFTYPWITSEN